MAVEDIKRFTTAEARVVHARLPAWEAVDQISVSAPSSIALSYRPVRGVTRSDSGPAVDRALPADSMGAAGAEEISWLRTGGPSEFVEVTGSPGLRRSVAAEMGVAAHADLDAVHDVTKAHPVAWALCAQLRSIARGGRPGSGLEVETLTRELYAHTLCTYFGGRYPRRRGALDRRGLARVTGFVEENLRDELTLHDLAAVATLSPFHFLRSFRNAMGVTPHAYVRMRRLEAARAAMERGTPPRAALRDVGYVNTSHARRAYLAHFGRSPW